MVNCRESSEPNNRGRILGRQGLESIAATEKAPDPARTPTNPKWSSVTAVSPQDGKRDRRKEPISGKIKLKIERSLIEENSKRDQGAIDTSSIRGILIGV